LIVDFLISINLSYGVNLIENACFKGSTSNCTSQFSKLTPI